MFDSILPLLTESHLFQCRLCWSGSLKFLINWLDSAVHIDALFAQTCLSQREYILIIHVLIYVNDHSACVYRCASSAYLLFSGGIC